MMMMTKITTTSQQLLQAWVAGASSEGSLAPQSRTSTEQYYEGEGVVGLRCADHIIDTPQGRQTTKCTFGANKTRRASERSSKTDRVTLWLRNSFDSQQAVKPIGSPRRNVNACS